MCVVPAHESVNPSISRPPFASIDPPIRMTTAATALPAPPTGNALSFLTLRTGCVVCSEATLEGPFPILIGSGTIIHPRAVLSAKFGPLTIGANNVVEEFAVLRAPPQAENGIELADRNLIRCGASVEASLGTGNVVECKAQVLPGATLQSGCLIGQGVVVELPVTADGTIMYLSAGQLCQRRRTDQLQANLEEIKSKDCLRDMLSKTHRTLH